MYKYALAHIHMRYTVPQGIPVIYAKTRSNKSDLVNSLVRIVYTRYYRCIGTLTCRPVINIYSMKGSAVNS